MKSVTIGAGAGFRQDRFDAAERLCMAGIDYIVFECLAERTMAQSYRNMSGGGAGFDPFMEKRLVPILPYVAGGSCKVITNMGAAAPADAARRVMAACKAGGYDDIRIASVSGDDVSEVIKRELTPDERERFVAAHAYTGAFPIVEALSRGADIVITGRTADPALFTAPLAHEFLWEKEHYEKLAMGAFIGHMLECAAQLTGGYFADGGRKKLDARSLAGVEFPAAEVPESAGYARFFCPGGSHGAINAMTLREQLAYELRDPSRYFTPDVTADFGRIRFEIIDKNDQSEIIATGARGSAPPERLKVSAGFRSGFLVEGGISYAGYRCVERCELARRVLEARLERAGEDVCRQRFSLVGKDSCFPSLSGGAADPPELRLRMAVHCRTGSAAEDVKNEMLSLYTNGPAGGGGIRADVRLVISLKDYYIPRGSVDTRIRMVGGKGSTALFMADVIAADIIGGSPAASPFLKQPRDTRGQGRPASAAHEGPPLKLGAIAHSRAGDKGNDRNLSLLPYEKEDYPFLKETITRLEG